MVDVEAGQAAGFYLRSNFLTSQRPPRSLVLQRWASLPGNAEQLAVEGRDKWAAGPCPASARLGERQ